MSEMTTVPVSVLVKRVNAYLQKHINLANILISGELSNVKRVSGHCYFNLKDNDGQISCTMWKSKVYGLDFVPEDGMQVIVHGSLNIYEKRGNLQLNVDSMQQAGLGALFIELEKRKKRLEQEGFFDSAHKKPKPEWIEEIAVVTGKSTAALQDVLQTLQTRWPMMRVVLYPASVQGEEAPAQIVEALKRADKGNHDAILLVRGGGSFEDLYCFNDERIVKALYDLKTYSVAGIGHEIDTTLADLAADHRALTPTAAAQWISPDQREIRQSLVNMEASMKRDIHNLFSRNAQRLMMAQSNPFLQNPLSWPLAKMKSLEALSLNLNHQIDQIYHQAEKQYELVNMNFFERVADFVNERGIRLSRLTTRLYLNSPKTLLILNKQKQLYDRNKLTEEMKTILKNEKSELQNRTDLLLALSPQAVLDRGYAIVQRKDQMISSVGQVKKGEVVQTLFRDGSLLSVIEEIKHGENDFSAKHDPS